MIRIALPLTLPLISLSLLSNAAAAADETDFGFFVGGVGGAYFLADPGELTIDVYKRDLNIDDRETALRAIFVGPGRDVIHEAIIPDAGTPAGSGLGPLGLVRFSTQVKRKGVYGLNVTVSRDGHGGHIVWGLRTNCPRWLIETARGHRNSRHEEPIVLAGSNRPADVCFLPREGPLAVEVADLPKGVEELQVYDGAGTLLAQIPARAGRATYTVPASVPRDVVPWRLRLPVGQGVVHIDGLTRWGPGDPYPNLSLWTPELSSYFPFQPYRWLLEPHRRTTYGQAGEPGEMGFRVRSNSGQRRIVDLSLEFPDAPWPVELSDVRLMLKPKQIVTVRLRYTAPPSGQTRVCHLRATPAENPAFSTYSTLTVRAGVAPAAKPIDMPIVLEPYRYENEQFGYVPDYPTSPQMYFDLENRPFSRTGRGIQALRGRRWITTDFRTAVTSSDGPSVDPAWSWVKLCPKVAFDRQGGVYVLGRRGDRIALLHSADGGTTFTVSMIPAREEGMVQHCDIEEFSGHNPLDGPPPILRGTVTVSDPQVRFRHIHEWELFLPELRGDRVVMGDPIPISDNCCVRPGHYGALSSVVSRDGKVHVVWGEATDPAEKGPGVPTFAATCDRATRKLGKPVLLGYGPPANDTHNTPAITIDGQGYLHVLIGTHNRPFPYVRSLVRNDAGGGWTQPELLVGNTTYIGLVCGPDGTLHAVGRMARYKAEPFPSYGAHLTLAYQRKRPGEPWDSPRVLVVPPFGGYVYYGHALTIDRTGRLFLSYGCSPTYWFYRTDHQTSRAVLMSPDGGDTWKLTTAMDLAPDP